MTGATIDHLVSLTVFLAALLIFIGLFNQINQTAITYQYHSYIATKCSDMLDSILLNPGYPSDWGVSSNSTNNLSFFGVQDPEFQEYMLSSLSLMKLLSPTAQQAYYLQTGEWYNNVSWDISGGYLLLNANQCANYNTVNSLLGLNGTYDFQLAITPTLTVAVSQVSANDLKLQIQVHGPAFPLSNATLSYLMFWANSSLGGYPILNSIFTSSILQTNSSGITYIDFPSLGNQTAFTFIVQACQGGLFGTGYLTHETVTSTGNLIPYIESFNNGTANILLAQKFGHNDPVAGMGKLYFNASFYVLPENFIPILAGNSANFTNYGSGINYQNLTVSSSNQTGFIVVAYTDGSSYGMVITSLGVGTLGMSVTFGSKPSGKGWVSTDLRQVLIGDIAYQAKLSLWSTQGYQGVS